MSGSSLASSLLVAMPQLADPNFRRSVVQIVHHDGDGTFGLVVNRGSGVTTGDLCDSLEIPWTSDRDEEVGTGGPVQPETGWVLFAGGGPGELPGSHEITEGLHFAGSLEALRQIGERPPEQVRIFLGYAGWGPGQLEMELTQGAWLVVPTVPELVFAGGGEEVWHRVLRRLGIDPATLVPTPGIH